MIVSLSPPGVKCQVGDFVMLVDMPSEAFLPAVASAKAGAKASRPPRANLILRTRTKLPIEFPLSPEIIAGAGEYEISGVRVRGINLGKETGSQNLRTVYSAELEGIRLAFLGELGGESVGEVLDKLGGVDVLFLSPSRGGTKQVATLIKQIDPKIIIPVGNASAKLLAEELGQKVKTEEKLVIKKKDLDKEQSTNKLVWLKS